MLLSAAIAAFVDPARRCQMGELLHVELIGLQLHGLGDRGFAVSQVEM
jgi:hypothetical protein